MRLMHVASMRLPERRCAAISFTAHDAPSRDRRDERLTGVKRHRVELVELADALDDLADRRVGGDPVGHLLQRLPVCTWITASRSGTGADASGARPPNWATSPSHTVIADGDAARAPTVVAGVIGRRRCDARDISTPVPR